MITCAPKPQTMPPPDSRAASIAADDGAEVRAPPGSTAATSSRPLTRSRPCTASRNPPPASCSRGSSADTCESRTGRIPRRERHGHGSARLRLGRSLRPDGTRDVAIVTVRLSTSHRRSCRSDSRARRPRGRRRARASRPANAQTSISSDDFGRWKFVSRPPSTRNRCPGWMNSSLRRRPAARGRRRLAAASRAPASSSCPPRRRGAPRRAPR